MSVQWLIRSKDNADQLHEFLLRSIEEGRDTILSEKEYNRSERQNRATWAFMSDLAQHMDARGITLRDAQEAISTRIDVRWDKDVVRVNIWGPIQEAITKKKSTTTLTNAELTKIVESVQRFAASNFDIQVGFGFDGLEGEP